MINRLFHCFGSATSHAVDTQLAVAMLQASGCRHLAVNTHTIAAIHDANDLPVGYSSATLGSVMEAAGGDLIPVLNINLPTTASEAIERTRRAVNLTGQRIIKLEVLTDDHRLADNRAVLQATEALTRDGDLEIWPLITPDYAVYQDLVRLGCPMVRVMGSAISSRQGILPDWRPRIQQIIDGKHGGLMLDGGMGDVEHAIQAMNLGFDCVLVNSCLFQPPVDPIQRLQEFHEALLAIA